jgi:hypothetical protein
MIEEHPLFQVSIRVLPVKDDYLVVTFQFADQNTTESNILTNN